MVPWREAWHEALYGAGGFYWRPEGPAGHFTTSTHGPLGALLAGAIGRLADREGATHVVDVGCGRGELLTHLAAARPDLGLTGVDVVDRPTHLPEDVAWLRSPGGSALPDELVGLEDVLVVAHEWLDVVPCTVVEVTEGGTLAVVLVDPATGAEELGPPPGEEDAAWVAARWPRDLLEPGTRVEVGRTRDLAWDDLAARVRTGTVLAVDYGHTRDTRPGHGTLAGYREGTLVATVPDGTCDLTAHVAVDSLVHDELATQREALRSLGVRGDRPDEALARTDPAGYLHALAAASSAAALTDPSGLGGFHWVLRRAARM